jgi:hypothetical protein
VGFYDLFMSLLLGLGGTLVVGAAALLLWFRGDKEFNLVKGFVGTFFEAFMVGIG